MNIRKAREQEMREDLGPLFAKADDSPEEIDA